MPGVAEPQLDWIAPYTARQWLLDGAEIAFIDLQEEGRFALGHPLRACNIPYSRLELNIGKLEAGHRALDRNEHNGAALTTVATMTDVTPCGRR